MFDCSWPSISIENFHTVDSRDKLNGNNIAFVHYFCQTQMKTFLKNSISSYQISSEKLRV